MTGDELLSIPEMLRAALRDARNLVVLTGAGMSTECGVPVFRGKGGLWEGHRPEELATPQAFARDPQKVLRWYRWRLDKVLAAEPHAGHRALVDLEQRGGLDHFCIVTQNVDGMHQRAGSANVVELHGNLTRARCSRNCGQVAPMETIDPERNECPCGEGWLRPDVVWFGESLDPGSLMAASQSLETADMAWVIGTSAVVYPAAALPEMAARRGVVVVEVNPEPTPLTDAVPHSFRTTASEGTRALARALARERGLDAQFQG
jgi:NAD-dependent deacetylase